MKDKRNSIRPLAKRVRAATLCFASLHLMLTLACAQATRNASQPSSATQASPSQQRTPSASSTPNTVAPLAHYEITPKSLPAPNEAEDAVNPPRVVARPEGARLNMPPGFKAETFAEGGFRRLRWITVAPNGDVFVADSEAGQVIILRDKNRDGVVEERFTFASGLKQPFGMAFWRDYFYVGNTDAVVRFRYQAGQTQAAGQPEKITDLPGRGYREHWTRNLEFNPQGTKLYVTIGSQSNVDAEPEPRASILEMNPDGTNRRIFASGTRNPIGLAFNPATKRLWSAVQERDRLGDDLPPDFVTEIKDGGFYGWPYSYVGQNVDPRRRGERPDLVRSAIVPDVLIQAHSAVLGLIFYTGNMFPAEYRGDAFVALHGSWNRSRRTGYKIVRIKFRDGKPVGGYDDFLTGWMLGEDRAEVWGRPVGLATLADGSVLITDDGANKVWRVTYTGRK